MTNLDVQKNEFLKNIWELMKKNKGKDHERFQSVYNVYLYINKNSYILKYLSFAENERKFLATIIKRSDDFINDVFKLYNNHPLKDEMLFLLAKVADECEQLLSV